jgi:hypothetical protein
MGAVTPLIQETYLAVLANSVGCNTFRTLYAEVAGVRQDITRDGELSCAFFVSSILKIFDWVKGVHGTVAGTVRDLEQSGWQVAPEPSPGTILVWEAQVDEAGETHAHIGFYLGDQRAVSNSSKERTPQQHHYTYHDSRKIVAIYAWSA